MPDTIEQVSSSIDALMQEFYTITNNLANVSTAGFKRRCNAFTRTLESQIYNWENYSPGEVNVESAFDFSQGHIKQTGRPLDLALYGNSFFVLETPEGPLYSRNGSFTRDQNSQIVDMEGRIVAGKAGAITIPENVGNSDINVSSDGTISANGTKIGQFRLVDFPENESKLVRAGKNCYQTPDDSVTPVPATNVIVKQGYQESSNVELIEELVDMIMVTRLYEANMKLLSIQRETGKAILDIAYS